MLFQRKSSFHYAGSDPGNGSAGGNQYAIVLKKKKNFFHFPFFCVYKGEDTKKEV